MVLFLTVYLDGHPFLKSVPTGGGTSLIHLRSLSTGENHGLAENAVLEYTQTDLAHSPLSVQLSGEYVGILFTVQGENETEWTKELVVWSWRTGVRKLVSIVGTYTTINSLADLLSRFYLPICDPLRFSATVLSWYLRGNHLRC
jgi:hypothetical protein